jgi:glycosyltransferase involved in cell wall biosynthesis
MRVLYLTSAAEPPVRGADATMQEVAALLESFEGESLNLYPFKDKVRPFPRFLYGLPRITDLRRAFGRSDIVHLFHALPYGFPVLSLSDRPLVYTVVAGLRGDRIAPPGKALRRASALVVSTGRDQAILQSKGYTGVEIIRPGLDLRGYSHRPCLPEKKMDILLGSAPWTRGQFRSKGILTALDAALAQPDLHLTFLWRGLLAGEVKKEIGARGLSGRVRVVNEKVDVNKLLGTVSAAAVLVDDPGLIKACPHSLIESLAAGKPVVVSRGIPMADYVEEKGCGVVVDTPQPEAFLEALGNLRDNYRFYQAKAAQAGGEDFSLRDMTNAYGELYRKVLAGS